MLLSILALPLIAPIALSLEITLLALLIASIVPLKAVEEFVRRLNAAISSVLGDCFIFTSSKIRQQSIVSKVLRDIDWLETNFGCERIIIVAHSQGAAVTHLALKKYCSNKISLLVTFGAGIVKLHQLEDKKRTRKIGFCLLVTMFAAVYEISAVAHHFAPDFIRGLPTWVGILSTVLFMGIAIFEGSVELTDQVKDQASKFADGGPRWVDFYASMDPVPNGPIFIPKAKDSRNAEVDSAELIESIELCNELSPIGDHTSYWENIDEFVPQLIDAIAAHGGARTFVRELTAIERIQASSFRRLKVFAKRIDDTIILIALFLFLFHSGHVASMGKELNTIIHDGCTIADCWSYSPLTTGTGAALLVYVLLSMLFSALRYLVELPSEEFEDVYFIFSATSAACHFIAVTALGWVLVVSNPEMFSWLATALQKIGSTTARDQSLVIGMAFGFLLMWSDLRRLDRLRRSLLEMNRS
ncbi:hypothetical protein XH89_20095 [Bradyrhizobium sp. CCBAU 53340]|nr:hypothetical protein XH89_20095 [Bradyrhizobium sp. CCBAU 53340]